LPRQEKLLKITQDKNKETPTLIINNSEDYWVPFWTGQKTYEILKNRGYNVEFNTRPGLGHGWKNEDIIKFLEKCFSKKTESQPSPEQNRKNTAQKIVITVGIIGGILIIILIMGQLIKSKRNRKN
jgi:hypothetical protein